MPSLGTKMLEQIDDTLWVAEGDSQFLWCPYPTRSVIARLKNGDLWVWSPVKLTAALRSEVDRLGCPAPGKPKQASSPLLAGLENSLSRGAIMGTAIDN